MVAWLWLAPVLGAGPPSPDRPVPAFCLIWLVAWAAFAAVLWWVHVHPRIWCWTLIVGLVARAILVPSDLILETDPYRYQFDGNLILTGENPYRHAPAVFPLVAGEDFRARLDQPGADFILQHISYPEIPTVYPPVAQAAFAGGAALTGWDWRGQRWVFLVVDLLVIAALWSFFRRRGTAPVPMLFYACNPLILKEVTNAAHLDVLVALFLVLTLVFSNESKRRTRAHLLAGWALGMAVLSKLYPVIFIPAVAIYAYRQAGRFREPLWMLLACGLTVVLGLAPFLGPDLLGLTEGLSRYARSWTMNQGAYELFALIGEHGRLAGYAVIALTALALAWRARHEHRVEALAGTLAATALVWWLFMPSPFPWYGVPLLALVPCTEQRAWLWIGLAFSLAGAGYYWGFAMLDAGLPQWRPLTGWLAHALVWSTILVTVGRAKHWSNETHGKM